MFAHDYEVGLHRSALDTPALLLDLNAMERNLATMARFVAEAGVQLRPHVKVHRATPALAHRQLQAGAIGVTCAKLSEAEVLAAAGIRDILIANQIVGERKLQRLVNLAAHTQVMVAVDDAENVATLSRAARARSVTVRVLVEVNIGHNRCGVEPDGAALDLARLVNAARGLEFMGLMGYDGHLTLKVAASEREALSRAANQKLVETRRYLENAGVPVRIVSAGGTFTYKSAALAGITELQAGSYLLMDTAFREHGVLEFEPALSLLATIISRPSHTADMAVMDLGRKAADIWLGLPQMKNPAEASVIGLSQEHGRLRLSGQALTLRPGDQVELWVTDANGTFNLYDKVYALRGDIVEAVWDIPTRGRST